MLKIGTWLANLLRGAATLSVFPAAPSNLPASRWLKRPDADALREDWRKIGGDMRRAIARAASTSPPRDAASSRSR